MILRTRLGSNTVICQSRLCLLTCVWPMLTWLLPGLFSTSGRLAAILAKLWSEHRRWIISVFDRKSIMNRLYWDDQQVGYVCFVPFVWEQRGVIAAVADQTAMISHLLPMCWATRGRSWGHVMMWARFGSQGSIALNWHSRYSGTRYSGTWLYLPRDSPILPECVTSMCLFLYITTILCALLCEKEKNW